MSNITDAEVHQLVLDKMASYTDADKEQLRIEFSEYKNAMGREADKNFYQFCVHRATMSVYYVLLQEGKVA